MSRNKKAFFIVPHRGGHRARDREDDLSTMDFSVRKEGLRILSNITGGREGVNLKRLLPAMKSQGVMGRRAFRQASSNRKAGFFAKPNPSGKSLLSRSAL